MTEPPTTKAQAPSTTQTAAHGPILLPRITITFCTQCKWNLRAAYYAQELLQTFGTSLGEVALVPATGGIFVIELFHRPAVSTTRPRQAQPQGQGQGQGGVDEVGNGLGPGALAAGDARKGEGEGEGEGEGAEGLGEAKAEEVEVQRAMVWDRKFDGGFPETNTLKGRVRDLVEPDRGLGHTDRALQKDMNKRGGEGLAEVKKGQGRDAEGNAETRTGDGKAKDCEDCR